MAERRGAAREIAIVVVSILIAFALDAAWDRFREGSTEDALLRDLEVEFIANRGSLLEARETQLRALNNIGLALHAVPDGEAVWLPDSVVSRSVIAAGYESGDQVLAGALNSGTLNLISDQALRDHLAGWSTLHSDLRANEVAARNYARDILWPAYAGAGDVSHVVTNWAADLLPEVDAIRQSDPGDGRVELVNSGQLRGLVGGRSYGVVGSIQAIDELLDAADAPSS